MVDYHSFAPRSPEQMVKDAIQALQRCAQGEKVELDLPGLAHSLRRLDEQHVDTSSFRAGITPDLMRAAVRHELSEAFSRLDSKISEFRSLETDGQRLEVTRRANLTPNIPATIDGWAGVAARFGIPVTDLYPRNYVDKVATFSNFWDRREHSDGGYFFPKQMHRFMESVFTKNDTESLVLPRPSPSTLE